MGRLKEYSEQEVIDSALNCFWLNGYENTSVRMLEKEMGINQFSIYSSFKNKSNLYQRVLKNYVERLDDTYLKNLNGPESTVDDIEQFLISFGCDMKSGIIPGSCLMVRSILDYQKFDEKIQSMIDSFVKHVASLYAKALKNSVSKGLIGKNYNISQETQFLLGITQSLSVINKTMTKRQLISFIKNSMSKLR